MNELILEVAKTYHTSSTSSHIIDLKRKHTMQLLRQIHKQHFSKFTVEFFHIFEETESDNFTRLRTRAIITDYK